MIVMRFLLPKLMRDAGISTAYGLTKASHGAIPLTTANRLVKSGDRPKRLDMDTLQALCDLFDIDAGDLFEREKLKRR